MISLERTLNTGRNGDLWTVPMVWDQKMPGDGMGCLDGMLLCFQELPVCRTAGLARRDLACVEDNP